MKRILLILAFVLPLNAQAAIITTSAGASDVTTVIGAPENLPALIDQVWWNNSDLAFEFEFAAQLELLGTSVGSLFESPTNSANYARPASALFLYCNDTCLANSGATHIGKFYEYYYSS